MIFNHQSGGGSAGVEIIAEEINSGAGEMGQTYTFDKPASFVCIGWPVSPFYARLLPGEEISNGLIASFSKDGTSFYLRSKRSYTACGWTAFG